MISLYVPDVGDGLAAGIHTIFNSRIQIDCGSQQHQDRALYELLYRIRPEAFILSHFHTDHYNGLLRWRGANQLDGLSISEVYFPRIPMFAESTRFAICFFAASFRSLGWRSGSLDVDLLNVLSKINRTPFSYRAVSAGDVIEINGSSFNVLWPPAVLDSEDALVPIRRAIEDFDTALEEDEDLRRIYYQLQEGEGIRPYLPGNETVGERPGLARPSVEEETFPFVDERRKLPEVVRRANDSLREAANHLSLAFYEDNRLLFLGDLEKSQIRSVAEGLVTARKTRFFSLMAAHHGTHWHDKLRGIEAEWVVCSIGSKLFKKKCPEYRDIAGRCLFTYLTGDAHISLAMPWQDDSRWIRHWNNW